jgi:hypothetical protein
MSTPAEGSNDPRAGEIYFASQRDLRAAQERLWRETYLQVLDHDPGPDQDVRASTAAGLAVISFTKHNEAENNAIIATAMCRPAADHPLDVRPGRLIRSQAKGWAVLEGALGPRAGPERLTAPLPDVYQHILEMREWADRWIVAFETERKPASPRASGWWRVHPPDVDHDWVVAYWTGAALQIVGSEDEIRGAELAAYEWGERVTFE